jgi:hypothetical protein
MFLPETPQIEAPSDTHLLNRPNTKKHLTKEKRGNIIGMHMTNVYSQVEIAEKLGVHVRFLIFFFSI